MYFEQAESQPLIESPGTLPGGPSSVGTARDGGWMLATLFLPDGSALDSAFVVVDGLENQVPLDVRGLTGAVRVGDVQRRSSR